MQTLAGVILALLALAYLKAALAGQGGQWLRTKILGG